MREESTLHSTEFFRSIINSISSTLCVIDEDSTIVFVNDSWNRFFQENGGSHPLIGTRYLQACSNAAAAGDTDGEAAVEGLDAVMSGQIPEFQLEYPCHSPQEKRWFVMTARPLKWSGQKLVVIKHKNITAQKLAEIAVHAKNQELARSNRELDQFAHIASHDLQEPIRSVSSMADFMATDSDSTLSPAAIQAKDFMLASCERMQELIRGLLEYGRIGHKRTPAKTDLRMLLQDILQDLQTRISERGAHVEVADDLPCMTLYAVEIRMLFQNLIANALKFCPPERTPQVRISAQATGPHAWRFSITDNGIGIAKGQEENIFMIFRRTAEGAQFEGSGIGLAHCRKIAELHGGRIWVESSGKDGSTFCVDIHDVTATDEG